MGIAPEARPADDEARAQWRSGQNRSVLQAEKRFWAPQEGGCRRFKFSVAASVGASVLRTEVSTGHPFSAVASVGASVLRTEVSTGHPFSAVASVGASVLCTEVSTGHPRPGASTIGQDSNRKVAVFLFLRAKQARLLWALHPKRVLRTMKRGRNGAAVKIARCSKPKGDFGNRKREDAAGSSPVASTIQNKSEPLLYW